MNEFLSLSPQCPLCTLIRMFSVKTAALSPGGFAPFLHTRERIKKKPSAPRPGVRRSALNTSKTGRGKPRLSASGISRTRSFPPWRLKEVPFYTARRLPDVCTPLESAYLRVYCTAVQPREPRTHPGGATESGRTSLGQIWSAGCSLSSLDLLESPVPFRRGSHHRVAPPSRRPSSSPVDFAHAYAQGADSFPFNRSGVRYAGSIAKTVRNAVSPHVDWTYGNTATKASPSPREDSLALNDGFSGRNNMPKNSAKSRRLKDPTEGGGIRGLICNIHDISDMSPQVLTAAATTAAKHSMKVRGIAEEKQEPRRGPKDPPYVPPCRPGHAD